MNKKIIPYGRQKIDPHDLDAVRAVLRSDWLTCGPAVEKFEKELCKVTGAKYAVACANGTAALHLACMALGIKKGDLGITSPITFLASANCLEFCGGKVDFVDIDPETLCLSPLKLEEYCKKVRKPKVVIPVDFTGVPADLSEIWKLSKKYGFRVIEDAAHSLGSTYSLHGKTYACGCCAHSDMAILSFHPVKTITTGEGGAITTNDPDLAKRLRLFRSHGMTKDPSQLTKNDGPWYYEMHELGYNYRITEIQCALGISQLKKLSQFKKRRQEIARQYNKAFASYSPLTTHHSQLTLPPWPAHSSPCFHLYPIQFTGGEKDRLSAFEYLKSKNILTQVHYYPVHLQPYYVKKYGYKKGKCPIAEKYYEGCLSLPLYPALENKSINYIIAKVLVLIDN